MEGKTAASHGAQDWGSTYARSRSDESENVVCQRRRSFNVSRCSDRTSERRKSTPAGVYTILERMQNKVLRGNLRPDGTREYETPVKYWMRVTYSGVGFS